MEAISFGAAFLAGVVSFVSPCVLPMLPTFVLILATGEKTSWNNKTPSNKERSVARDIDVAMRLPNKNKREK